MNKFHIALFSIILAVFFGIIVTTEEGAMGNKTTASPTLPPEGSTFQIISPTASPNLQKLQGQQQVAGAQTQQQIPANEQQAINAMQGPIAASVSATIKTSKGDIDIILFGDVAPNTVRNFIVKADSNFYKGLIFHRVEDWVIQGGDPNGNGTGGGEMAAETTQKPFVVGSIGMARGNNPQINNDSQFFITKTAADWLDGQYTNFGIVTSGMDVVNSIQIGDKIEGITINNQ